MENKGQKFIAKCDIKNLVEKGATYTLTSSTRDHCVLDNKILLSVSELDLNFEELDSLKKPHGAVIH